jgi:hypothetical protein
VGRTPDGGSDPAVSVGAILIRLPKIDKEEASPGIVQRLTTLTRRAEFTPKLPLPPLADVLKRMGSTATLALLARPKMIAGTTLVMIVSAGVSQLWHGKHEAVEAYPAPEVEFAEALIAPPGTNPMPMQPGGAAWPSAPGALDERRTAPGPVAEIASDQIVPFDPLAGARPMPSNYETATQGQPAPQAWNAPPAERMARVPNLYSTPTGPITPPPAPSKNGPTARFEGGIVPPAMGSQP